MPGTPGTSVFDWGAAHCRQRDRCQCQVPCLFREERFGENASSMKDCGSVVVERLYPECAFYQASHRQLALSDDKQMQFTC